jgi:fermentation-respiration switch protein FrsA (DUF1100 family)
VAALASALAASLLFPPVCAIFMAYPPAHLLVKTPRLPYENVAFPSLTGGVQLKGWYIPAAGGSDRTVILAHGFLNDRLIHGRGLPLAEALEQRGFNVLLFDLRGHGQSPAVPVTFGAREQGDVAGAVQYARERGAVHVGMLGFSIGAVSAILAASADPGIDAVVADSAFADLHGYLETAVLTRSHLGRSYVGARYAAYSLSWYRLLTGTDERAVRPEAVIARLGPRPVLLIHGAADRVIPVAESRKLLAAAQNPRAELWVVPGGRHTHSYEADPAAYTAKVAGFLDENVR